ncbi:hypothetical protein VKT23_015637 [Stygiomarasmius scandens]|uniref:Zinc finger PHD-type domain-containing protein n=1 Tax=Marasmiellus scandens TaxID=2682957 RepID=A0ABR1J078_9AGAR
MIAISSCSCDTPFIVFGSDGETGTVEVQIASALTSGLPRSIRLGFEIVGGLSAALDYLADNGVPCTSLGPDNFELYITREDQVKIGMDLNEVEKSSDVQNDDDALWELLNTLCIKTFRNANRLLYDDEHIKEEDFECSESRRNNLELPGPNTPLPSSEASRTLPDISSPSESFPLRRELMWKQSQRGSKTVSSIARQYRNRLRLAAHPYADSLRLRRFQGGPRRSITHRCQGYGKEQITLTSDVEDAALVLHTAPFPGEKCLICSGVVKENEDFRCACGRADNGFASTIKCSVCNLWQHGQCAGLNVDPRNFLCPFCDLVRDMSSHRHHDHDYQGPSTSSMYPVRNSTLSENLNNLSTLLKTSAINQSYNEACKTCKAK